jgi:hypothetical protein
LNFPGAVPPDEGVVVEPPPPLPPVPPEGAGAPPEGVVLCVCGVPVPLPLEGVPPLDGVPPATPPLDGSVVVGVVGTVSGVAGAVSPPGTVSVGGGGSVWAL